MKITKAEFIKSADTLKNCPHTGLPEIALIGRSNVGKSSFINSITNRKKLAKTSNTPGKTRLMNYFNINDQIIIVDLPGYGYAKVSKTEQQKWSKELENYLQNREELISVIQFIDARHDVQNNDIQMREWLKYYNIPMITIATKIDCLSKNKINAHIAQIAKKLDCEVIGFSAKNGFGSNQALDLIQSFKN